MRKGVVSLFCCLLLALAISAQKKPLDHSVYDAWQTIGERAISNDGKFVTYCINPQEGDGVLVIQACDNSYKKEIPRGYNPTITEDNKYVIFRIHPLFKDVRDARIKKKRQEDLPKDSLGIYSIGIDSLIKIARVKGYKMPEKAADWLAYQLEKPLPEQQKAKQQDSLTRVNNLIRMVDSLTRVTDSLRTKLNDVKIKGIAALEPGRKEEKKNQAINPQYLERRVGARAPATLARSSTKARQRPGPPEPGASASG